MVLTNKERQARYRAKARMAAQHLSALHASIEQAIDMAERAIALELDRGTSPGDGTAAGVLLEQLQGWVREERAGNLAAVEHVEDFVKD